MPHRFRIISVFFVLPLVSACVSTGTREITKSGTVNRLEPGRSTKTEVRELLGFPALVSYAPKGEESWNYHYVTEYPQAVDFLPIAGALSKGFKQTTRVLTVSFDRQGKVQNLQKNRTTGTAEIYPY